MKLLLLTSPDFFIEEDKILTTLFEEGLDVLHLRKPNSEPVFCERLLTLLPEEYHRRIVVHDHFYLKEEFGLMGIHLSHHNPTAPPDYRDTLTRTCYTLDEIHELKPESKYVILKNVYDSISEPSYVAKFTESDLRQASRQGIIDRHVMAQGGIALENIEEIREYGFGGVVIRGDLWRRFNIHHGHDYKELIAHFRKLRQITE
ncbi:MAG: thiamine phosphate synthase [Bacteroidaceae bacterium]|nr:thiamine phosphate synthase [Bacteroidaceae bacterium]MDE7166917.1 thiamine phosphate synthase [Bacteroidaceae bacterium]